jgi:hypothetical protein
MKFRKPSASMVVALIALVMAMGGSAVAASLITSKQIKNGTIQLADISKKAQKSLKGKAGANGATGATGPAGPQGAAGAAGAAGAKGDKGDKGDPGSARAFGYITSGGALSPDYASKGVVAVTRPSTGQYCIELDPSIDASQVEAITTVDWSATTAIAFSRSSDFGCTGVSNVLNVTTRQFTESAATSGAVAETAVNATFEFMVP